VRLLFIKLKHIGDALLLTPTLTAARAAYPAAEIWVVVRRGTEGILAGCPAIDRVLTSAAVEPERRTCWAWWSEVRLMAELRRARVDYAFDLTHSDRGRLLVGLSGARHRCADGVVYPPRWPWRSLLNGLSREDWSQGHRAEADWRVVNALLPLAGAAAGPLVFDRARVAHCRFSGGKPGVVLHPATRWARKRWLTERWSQLARAFTAAGHPVIVSVGPAAEEIALGEAIVADAGAGAVSTGGQLNWSQLAGLLHEARLFVGVDTAAMHLAAACGCPTVALFHSRAQAAVWSPWRVRSSVLLPPGAAAEGQMEEITVEAVWSTSERLLAPEGAPPLRAG